MLWLCAFACGAAGLETINLRGVQMRQHVTAPPAPSAPSAPAPASAKSALRGAAIFLISPDSQRSYFAEDAALSMKCAYKFFAQPRGYDVLAFHTMPEEQAAALQKQAPYATFIHVDYDWPEGISEDWLAQPGRCELDGVDYWATERKCGCTCPDYPDRDESDQHCW